MSMPRFSAMMSAKNGQKRVEATTQATEEKEAAVNVGSSFGQNSNFGCSFGQKNCFNQNIGQGSSNSWNSGLTSARWDQKSRTFGESVQGFVSSWNSGEQWK